MNYEVVPPAASAMLESLRGVGYSIETALADIVDNSLAAGARNVWVRAHFDPKNSWLSVLDDGSGMGVDELRQAMVLGGRGPSAPRAEFLVKFVDLERAVRELWERRTGGERLGRPLGPAKFP